MKYRESFIATLLVVFSVLVGIGVVEIGDRVYHRVFPPLYSWDRRIIFFDGPDSIFRNLDDIFTYVPNSNIFSRTIYFSESSYSTEFAYEFKTNNFGLIQDNDLLRGNKSVLLLGDSFTEGHGAEPWFRRVAPQIEQLNYQPINGGLLGTGFLDWWRLEQVLSANEVVLAKVVVIFISGDVDRGKWNFSKAQLDCLRSVNLCDGTETFVRLPPSNELGLWVGKIRTVRHDGNIKARIKSTLPATYAVYRFLLNFAAPPQTEFAKLAINNLVEKYGRENVLFIQLPQKEELKGTILPNGLRARKFILDVGAQYADEICSVAWMSQTFSYVTDTQTSRGTAKSPSASAGSSCRF